MSDPTRDSPPKVPSGEDIELPLASTWRPGTRPPVVKTPAEAPSPAPSPAPTTASEAEGSAPAEPPASRATPVVTKTEATCPKCGFRQAPGKACARCGLVYARWRPGMEDAVFAGVPPQVLSAARSLWTETAAAGGAERSRRLKAFQAFAMGNGASPFAGDCYRKWLILHPDDQEVARLRNQLVLEAGLLLPARPKAAGKEGLSRRGLLIGLAAGIALTGLTTWFFLNLFESMK